MDPKDHVESPELQVRPARLDQRARSEFLDLLVLLGQLEIKVFQDR